MSGSLACLAAACLCWPPARPRRRWSRLRPAAPARRRPSAALAELAGWRGAPAVAAVLVGAGAGALSTPVVAVLGASGAAQGVRAFRSRGRAVAGRRQMAALAEALGVLAAELRAGRSTAEATGTAVAGCPDPDLAAALGPVLRLGAEPGHLPTAAELRSVLARLACAVRLSARTGSSLAAVVSAVEDDLRARARAETELRAAVAGPRASAAVLAGLPVIGLLMGSGVGADPWRVLTTTGTGTVLLVAGAGLEATGLAWSARLVRRAVQR